MILSPVEEPHVRIFTFDKLSVTAAVLWTACHTGKLLLPTGYKQNVAFYLRAAHILRTHGTVAARYTTNTCSVSDIPTRTG